MYKRKLTTGKTCSINPFAENVVEHHSPSYYLRGGIDLSRRERAPLKSVPSHSEDISEGVVNILADPRVSAMDIAVLASERSVVHRKANARTIAEEIL